MKSQGWFIKISCCDCDAVYIGETGRSIPTRKREHVDAAKNLDVKKSALCQHVLDKDHLIEWGNVEILKRKSHWHRRCVAEEFLINQKALSMNVLNRNDGTIVPSVDTVCCFSNVLSRIYCKYRNVYAFLQSNGFNVMSYRPISRGTLVKFELRGLV